jgi:hypothetical protein
LIGWLIGSNLLYCFFAVVLLHEVFPSMSVISYFYTNRSLLHQLLICRLVRPINNSLCRKDFYSNKLHKFDRTTVCFHEMQSSKVVLAFCTVVTLAMSLSNNIEVFRHCAMTLTSLYIRRTRCSLI